jgi:hypothetical protein
MSEEEDAFEPKNTRMPAVRRFLSKPPKRATELLLHATMEGAENSSQQIGYWEKDDLRPEIARDICELMKDYAEGMQAPCTGLLTYRDNGTNALTSMPLRAAPESSKDADTALLQSDSSQLDGSWRSQASQAQRHTEVATKAALLSIGTMMQHMREMMDHQATMQSHQMDLMKTMAESLSERERYGKEQKERADELEQTLAEVEETRGTDAETTATQQRIIKLIEPVLPLIMAKMMGAGGSTPPQSGG